MEYRYKFGIEKDNVIQWYVYKSERLHIEARFTEDVSEATPLTREFYNEMVRFYKDEKIYIQKVRI